MITSRVVGMCLLAASVAAAGSEPGWVLWVETPSGSDQWSRAATFKTKEECENRARKLNDTEDAVARMERVRGDARDVYSCLPTPVDPRPEGALR